MGDRENPLREKRSLYTQYNQVQFYESTDIREPSYHGSEQESH
jgi:hypothetical protein